ARRRSRPPSFTRSIGRTSGSGRLSSRRSPRPSTPSTRSRVSSEVFSPASRRLMLRAEVPDSCARLAWVMLRLRRSRATRSPRVRRVASVVISGVLLGVIFGPLMADMPFMGPDSAPFVLLRQAPLCDSPDQIVGDLELRVVGVVFGSGGFARGIAGLAMVQHDHLRCPFAHLVGGGAGQEFVA